MSPAKPVRVAICDDSRTYAHALRRFLEHDGDMEVVGVHSTAEELLRALNRERPDLVTMDLELPGMDGVTATERIVRGQRPVPVVVLSAHARPGSERAAAALAGGAVEAILKGALPLTEAGGVAASAVRRRLRRLTRAQPRPMPAAAPRIPRSTPRRGGHRPVAAIGVAASTGGPQALAVLLTELPADFPTPIVVVQHMSVGFTEGLATWLDRQTPLPVRLAVPGTIAGPGVWFAPDGGHTTLDKQLNLGRNTRTGGRHVPSADVLFESMAATLGAAAAVVVLTGLGRDGAAGARAVLAAGGVAYAEDEASSVVAGMPGAAAAVGARVFPLDELGGALRRLTPAARP